MHLIKRHSTWHICYNVGRKKYSVSTRTSDKKAALRAFQAFRAPSTEPITIEQFLSAYHEHLKVTRVPTTVVRSEAMQRALSRHVAATRLLSTLTTRDIETFKVARLRGKISPHTLNSDLRHLKAALEVAVQSTTPPSVSHFDNSVTTGRPTFVNLGVRGESQGLRNPAEGTLT
jgi:hypothetical protein